MRSPRFFTQQRAFYVVGGLLALLLVLPLVALIVSTSPSDFLRGLKHPLVGPALRLSMITTLCSLAIIVVLGTPLAWIFAQATGRLTRAFETLTQLPIVIPPAVAGVALLLAMGRRGLLASWLGDAWPGVAFSTAAVILAQIFVGAPFYLQAATSAFRRLDPDLLLVARSLGASPWLVFFRLVLPLAAPGLLAGAAMSWARALGEFGATLMFAGNLQGVTQTLPLAIYTAMETEPRVAGAISIVLAAIAFLLLLLVRTVSRSAFAPREPS